MKIVRQHRKSAKNTTIGGPQLARIRDFHDFRDLGAHEAELDATTTFSITHRQTRDRHHSTDQNLEFRKKIVRAKTNRGIAGKSSSKVEVYRFPRSAAGWQLAARPPGITLKHLCICAGSCSTIMFKLKLCVSTGN